MAEEPSYYSKIRIYHLPYLEIEFVVSIGAKPITLMWDEKHFFNGSEWFSIH